MLNKECDIKDISIIVFNFKEIRNPGVLRYNNIL